MVDRNEDFEYLERLTTKYEVESDISDNLLSCIADEPHFGKYHFEYIRTTLRLMGVTGAQPLRRVMSIPFLYHWSQEHYHPDYDLFVCELSDLLYIGESFKDEEGVQVLVNCHNKTFVFDLVNRKLVTMNVNDETVLDLDQEFILKVKRFRT